MTKHTTVFDNWFDPIETEVRARSRQFIEELIRGELDAALARTHRSLNKDAPVSRPVQRTGTIKSHPILGGLHHR
jgi:hypothetical protein